MLKYWRYTFFGTDRPTDIATYRAAIAAKKNSPKCLFWPDFLSRPQKHHIDRNITHKIHWLEPRQTLINSFDKYWHLILSWTIFKLRQGASITCFVCRSVGRSVCPKNVYLQYFNILLQMSNNTGAYCFPSLFFNLWFVFHCIKNLPLKLPCSKVRIHFLEKPHFFNKIIKSLKIIKTSSSYSSLKFSQPSCHALFHPSMYPWHPLGLSHACEYHVFFSTDWYFFTI